MRVGAGTYASSRFSVNSSNHSGRSRKRSSEALLLYLSLFLCWIFGGSRDQFLGANSSRCSDAGLGGVLDDVLDESCDGDVEDEHFAFLSNSIMYSSHARHVSIWCDCSYVVR